MSKVEITEGGKDSFADRNHDDSKSRPDASHEEVLATDESRRS